MRRKKSDAVGIIVAICSLLCIVVLCVGIVHFGKNQEEKRKRIVDEAFFDKSVQETTMANE